MVSRFVFNFNSFRYLTVLRYENTCWFVTRRFLAKTSWSLRPCCERCASISQISFLLCCHQAEVSPFHFGGMASCDVAESLLSLSHPRNRLMHCVKGGISSQYLAMMCFGKLCWGDECCLWTLYVVFQIYILTYCDVWNALDWLSISVIQLLLDLRNASLRMAPSVRTYLRVQDSVKKLLLSGAAANGAFRHVVVFGHEKLFSKADLDTRESHGKLLFGFGQPRGVCIVRANSGPEPMGDFELWWQSRLAKRVVQEGILSCQGYKALTD